MVPFAGAVWIESIGSLILKKSVLELIQLEGFRGLRISQISILPGHLMVHLRNYFHNFVKA